MKASTFHEVQILSRLTFGKLQEKYLDIFGE